MATNYVLEGVRRVSSLGGRIVSATSTMTLEEQEAGLRSSVEAYAALTGQPWRLGGIVDAVDESGFTFAAGDTMAEVLERVERGERAGVVFAYFDRNGRNWWDQGPFFSRLSKADGRYVVRGMESIDYREPMGRQLFGSMSVASEMPYFAARDRGDNIVEGIMARKVPNRVAYGYARNGTFVDGKLAQTVDEHRDPKALVKADTAAVVERIYKRRLAGAGASIIARELNADDIPGPSGGRWVASTVASIVSNPLYKGTITLGRRKRDRSKGTNIRTVQDAAIAIVSADDWKNAQSAVKLQRTGTYRAGVAGGVLVCESCGGTLSVIGTGKGEKARRLYGCRRGSATHTCPKPVHVTKSVADDYVDTLVEAALADTERGKITAVDASRAVDDAKATLDAAEAERSALKDKVGFSHPKFVEWLADADDTVEAAQSAYEDAVALAGRVRNFPTADDYRTWSDDDRNAVARDLLRVVVAPPLSRSKFATITDRFTVAYN